MRSHDAKTLAMRCRDAGHSGPECHFGGSPESHFLVTEGVTSSCSGMGGGGVPRASRNHNSYCPAVLRKRAKDAFGECGFNTKLSEFFGPRQVLERELSEFRAPHYLSERVPNGIFREGDFQHPSVT